MISSLLTFGKLLILFFIMAATGCAATCETRVQATYHSEEDVAASASFSARW